MSQALAQGLQFVGTEDPEFGNKSCNETCGCEIKARIQDRTVIGHLDVLQFSSCVWTLKMYDLHTTTILNRNFLAVTDRPINSAGGECDIKWDVVVMSRQGFQVGPNLVDDVTTLHEQSARIVDDDRVSDVLMVKFPGCQ